MSSCGQAAVDGRSGCLQAPPPDGKGPCLPGGRGTCFRVCTHVPCGLVASPAVRSDLAPIPATLGCGIPGEQGKGGLPPPFCCRCLPPPGLSPHSLSAESLRGKDRAALSPDPFSHAPRPKTACTPFLFWVTCWRDSKIPGLSLSPSYLILHCPGLIQCFHWGPVPSLVTSFTTSLGS